MAVAASDGPLQKARGLLEEYGLSKAEEARSLLLEARATAQGRGDAQGQADAIRVLVDIHIAKREHDDAARLAREAAMAFEDRSKRAGQLLLVAQIHLGREGGWSEASAALDEARSLFKEASDRHGEAEATAMAAQIQFEGGDLEAALRELRAALEQSRDPETAAQKGKRGAQLLLLAQISLGRDAWAEAMATLAEAEALYKEAGDKGGESAALAMQAQMHLEGGEIDAAIQTARDALQRSSQAVAGGDAYGKQSALHTLANAYFARCDLEEGLKCAREALALLRQSGDLGAADALRAAIEQARAMTQEYRKSAPKRPFVLPPSAVPPRPSGPQVCPLADSAVSREALETAAAGRKYWGNPTQVEADPSVDALDRAPSHSVIWGMALTDNAPTQVCVEFGDLLACMAKGDVAKIPIVILTCGVFGRQVGEHQAASMTNVSAATIWGMARTARQEVPSVQIQLLDYSEAMTAAEIPRTIRPMLPESAYYHKARWEPQIAAVHSLFRRDLRRDNLTGGGAGPKDDKEGGTKFLRKTFAWTGPSHKMDFCWYRQEWRACGPAFEEPSSLPPPPPCRAMRSC